MTCSVVSSANDAADEQQLRQRGGARDIHQRMIAAARAEQRHGGLDQRQPERQHQRVMSGFRDHFDSSLRSARPRPRRRAWRRNRPSSAPASSGRRRRPWACRSRHAWRAPCRPGTRRRHRARLRRRRPALRGTGRAGFPCRRPAAWRCRRRPETDREIVAAHQRARLHQAAEAEPLAGRDLLLGRHRRRREEHDGIAHGVEHQRRRDREHRERAADHGQTPLLARHAVSSVPASVPTSCLIHQARDSSGLH